MVPHNPGNNVAAHWVPEMIRQSGNIACQAALLQRRRTAAFFSPPLPSALPEEAQPQVTSLKLEVTRTLTIRVALLAADMGHYELIEGDQVLDDVVADTDAEALLGFAIRLEEEGSPDQPND